MNKTSLDDVYGILDVLVGKPLWNLRRPAKTPAKRRCYRF
jgi:hypothetical protein